MKYKFEQFKNEINNPTVTIRNKHIKVESATAYIGVILENSGAKQFIDFHDVSVKGMDYNNIDWDSLVKKELKKYLKAELEDSKKK